VPGKVRSLVGCRYGRLSVLSLSHVVPKRGAVWDCKCSCGAVVKATTGHLQSGDKKSCGCFNRDQKTEQCRSRSSHGHATRREQSATYIAWCNMHSRCRKESPDASRYFDRGIVVCERWNDFRLFLADMGERPKGLTLDRKDNDKGYEPLNCEWRPWRTQQNNKSDNHILNIKGERITMADAARRFGITYSTLRSRLNILGWSDEKAVGL